MMQTCQVCLHPERAAIDALLRARKLTQEQVGAQFGISQSAVSRHMRKHLALRVRQLERWVEPLVGEVPDDIHDLRTRLAKIEEMLWRGTALAEAARELKLLPHFARQLTRCLELVKLFDPGQQEAAAQLAEAQGAVAVLQAVILQALADNPEARQKVAAALVASQESASEEDL